MAYVPSRVQSDQGKENKGALSAFGRTRTKVLLKCFTDYFIISKRRSCWTQPISSIFIVYVPRINLGLILFRSAWNKHDLRTEHALTPKQLFVAEALQLHNSRMVALEFFDNIQSNNYGVVEGVWQLMTMMM